MEQKTYQVWAYNTCTNKYEQCSVTKEQYDAFRRTGWNIQDNDDSFKAHQTVFSNLKGGTNCSFENFHEFIDESDAPLNDMLSQERLHALQSAMQSLSPLHREVIELLFFHEPPLTATQAGALLGITKRAVNKRRKAAEGILFQTIKDF